MLVYAWKIIFLHTFSVAFIFCGFCPVFLKISDLGVQWFLFSLLTQCLCSRPFKDIRGGKAPQLARPITKLTKFFWVHMWWEWWEWHRRYITCLNSFLSVFITKDHSNIIGPLPNSCQLEFPMQNINIFWLICEVAYSLYGFGLTRKKYLVLIREINIHCTHWFSQIFGRSLKRWITLKNWRKQNLSWNKGYFQCLYCFQLNFLKSKLNKTLKDHRVPSVWFCT